jgi:hypothetical protein
MHSMTVANADLDQFGIEDNFLILVFDQDNNLLLARFNSDLSLRF